LIFLEFKKLMDFNKFNFICIVLMITNLCKHVNSDVAPQFTLYNAVYKQRGLDITNNAASFRFRYKTVGIFQF
jgi:hypothetical protein